MNSRLGRMRWILIVSAVILVPAATSATAETVTTRAEYVERAEPICKENVLANKRIFKGAKGEVKAGKLKKASRHFFRAATAFAKTIKQLEAVERPSSDAARLSQWFRLLRDEKSLIEKIGRSLAAGDKHGAESYSVDLNRNSTQANNTVLGFSFNYCRIDAARFG